MVITHQPSNGRVDAATFWTSCGSATSVLQKKQANRQKQPNNQNQSTVTAPIAAGAPAHRLHPQACREDVHSLHRSQIPVSHVKFCKGDAGSGSRFPGHAGQFCCIF